LLGIQNKASTLKLNQITIALSLLFGLVAIFYIRFGNRENVFFLTKEDGAVENLSAIFYLVGFFVSLISIFRKEHVLLAIIWAALCFLFLGEETSWFQRLLGYSVPFVEQQNLQHEFNIHNLAIFGGSNLTELLAGFDLKIFLNVICSPQTLFQIGFFGYFIIIPLSLHISKINTLMSNIGYKKTDTSFILVILSLIALTFFLRYNCSSDVKNDLSEIRELLYAYFIMIYIILYIYPQQK